MKHTINLDDELYRKLQKAVDKPGVRRSVSNLASLIIETWFEEQEKEQEK